MWRKCIVTLRHPLLLKSVKLLQSFGVPLVEFGLVLFQAVPRCLLISPLPLILEIELIESNENLLLLLARLVGILRAAPLVLSFALFLFDLLLFFLLLQVFQKLQPLRQLLGLLRHSA